MPLQKVINAICIVVDEYRTASGSDRVGLAINTSPFHGSPRTPAYNDGEGHTSQTRSLQLPVLYSSTHEGRKLEAAAAAFATLNGGREKFFYIEDLYFSAVVFDDSPNQFAVSFRRGFQIAIIMRDCVARLGYRQCQLVITSQRQNM